MYDTLTLSKPESKDRLLKPPSLVLKWNLQCVFKK